MTGMENYIWWISGVSLLSAVATLLTIPWAVARLPEDYFHHKHRENWSGFRRAPAIALVFGVVKNLVGAVLLVLGIVMLFIPGQGLLTILVGLLLMNFPGKYRLERWLVERPGVLRSLNWLRKRQGCPPFRLP